jgi:hypothetical protein
VFKQTDWNFSVLNTTFKMKIIPKSVADIAGRYFDELTESYELQNLTLRWETIADCYRSFAWIRLPRRACVLCVCVLCVCVCW